MALESGPVFLHAILAPLLNYSALRVTLTISLVRQSRSRGPQVLVPLRAFRWA